METKKIICDECKADLTEISSGYPEDRLELSCKRIYNTSTISFDMLFYPTLARTYHFCNKLCLKKWVNK